MLFFVLKRLLTLLATLAVASALIFAVLELLPGNAADVILGETANAESRAALEAKLGLNRPALQRYGDWVGGLLRGETALSISYDTPDRRTHGRAPATSRYPWRSWPCC